MLALCAQGVARVLLLGRELDFLARRFLTLALLPQTLLFCFALFLRFARLLGAMSVFSCSAFRFLSSFLFRGGFGCSFLLQALLLFSMSTLFLCSALLFSLSLLFRLTLLFQLLVFALRALFRCSICRFLSTPSLFFFLQLTRSFRFLCLSLLFRPPRGSFLLDRKSTRLNSSHT